jgi:hypothetical protein
VADAGDRTTLVSGGYFLVRPFWPSPDPMYFPPDLVTPPVVTLATCLGDLLPEDLDLSTTPMDDVLEEALELWRAGRLAWGDAFADLDATRRFAERFLGRPTDARLIGLGMDAETAAEFRAAYERDATSRLPGDTGWPAGVHDVLCRGEPIEPGGRALGYEVLDVAARAIRGDAGGGWADRRASRRGAGRRPLRRHPAGARRVARLARHRVRAGAVGPGGAARAPARDAARAKPSAFAVPCSARIVGTSSQAVPRTERRP